MPIRVIKGIKGIKARGRLPARRTMTITIIMSRPMGRILANLLGKRLEAFRQRPILKAKAKGRVKVQQSLALVPARATKPLTPSAQKTTATTSSPPTQTPTAMPTQPRTSKPATSRRQPGMHRQANTKPRITEPARTMEPLRNTVPALNIAEPARNTELAKTTVEQARIMAVCMAHRMTTTTNRTLTNPHRQSTKAAMKDLPIPTNPRNNTVSTQTET